MIVILFFNKICITRNTCSVENWYIKCQNIKTIFAIFELISTHNIKMLYIFSYMREICLKK